MKHFTTRTLTLTGLAAIFLTTFLFASPVLAEEGGSKAAEVPAGIGVLILVMGLGAILLVGLYYLSQSNPPRQDELDDDEDE